MKKWMSWLIGAALAGGIVLASEVITRETRPGATVVAQSDGWRAAGLGTAAAFAIAVSVLGAGYAVGRIGSAAIGAAAEKPELLMRSILFMALAEGLAVLGFAIAMMLLNKI
jgi:V/A-type H+-transporting ATPase subunit K